MTPAPEIWENVVTPYGIRVPKPSAPAAQLPTMFDHLAADVSAALQAAAVSPAPNANVHVALSTAARDAHYGVPTSATARRTLQDSGALCIRPDLGTTERYFAGLTDGGANPGGVVTAGWYTVSGPGTGPVIFRRTTGTTATGSSFLPLTFDTKVRGGNEFQHAAGVFTCNASGTYRIGMNLSWGGGSTTGSRGARLAGSGAIGTRQTIESAATSSLDIYQRVELLTIMAAGDTVTAQGLQSSGGSLASVGDITFERIV